MNLLDSIKHEFETFSRSERKVAEVILEMPQTVIHSSIASIAQIANVSEPTVNRFCHRMNTKGFPDFKLHLAQQLANNAPISAQKISATDSVSQYTDKIFATSMACLDQARKTLDPDTLEQVINCLKNAQKIVFCGLGLDAIIAKDAYYRFIATGKHVSYIDDEASIRIAQQHAEANSVFILFSPLQLTTDKTCIVQINVHGKTSPIFMPPHHFCLNLDIDHETDQHLSSRLAQMTLMDVLATGVNLALNG